MSAPDNPCQEKSCVGGNCPGCRDGHLWCDDPRCHPYCRGCQENDNSNTFDLIIFGVIILAFVIIIIIVYVSLKPKSVLKRFSLRDLRKG